MLSIRHVAVDALKRSQLNPSRPSHRRTFATGRCMFPARASDVHDVKQLHDRITVNMCRAAPGRVHDVAECQSLHSCRSAVADRIRNPYHVPELHAQATRSHDGPVQQNFTSPDESAIGICVVLGISNVCAPSRATKMLVFSRDRAPCPIWVAPAVLKPLPCTVVQIATLFSTPSMRILLHVSATLRVSLSGNP